MPSMSFTWSTGVADYFIVRVLLKTITEDDFFYLSLQAFPQVRENIFVFCFENGFVYSALRSATCVTGVAYKDEEFSL